MNTEIGYKEYYELLKFSAPITTGVTPIGFVQTLYGYPCVLKKSGVLIFRRCDYCKEKDVPLKGLYDGYYCPHCGAPV